MKNITRLSLLCLCLLLLSCNRPSQEVDRIFLEVSNLVEDYPDSALVLLDSIIYLAGMNERQENEYILLTTQARDKGFKDISGDTLIFAVSDYFVKKEDWYNATLSKFYCGRVYHMQKEYRKAILAYLEAETLSGNITDNNLKGLIQYFIGEVYYEQLSLSEAIKRFKKAYDYFHLSPDNYKQKIHTLNCLASSYLVDSQKDSSFYYFDKSLELAELFNDSILIMRVKRIFGVALVENGDLESAKDIFLSSLAFSKDEEQTVFASLNLAFVYSELNIRDSVMYYIEPALNYFEKTNNKASISTVYYLLSSIESTNKNYEKALEYSQKYTELISEISDKRFEEHLQEAEKKYNFELIRNERNQLMIDKQKSAILILILLFLMVILTFYYFYCLLHNRSRQAEKELSLLEARQKIEELQNIADKYGSEKNELHSQLLDKLEIFRKASQLEYNIQLRSHDKITNKEFIRKMNEILYGQEEQDWKQLFRAMDKSTHGFLSHLKEHYKDQLTEQEYKICSLTYVGFDNITIATILKLSKNTVQQRKWGIRQKLNIDSFGDFKSFFDTELRKIKTI